MPEFTNTDRRIIEAESALWNINTIIGEVLRGGELGEFTDSFKYLSESVVNLAREMRDYNDQFETEE